MRPPDERAFGADRRVHSRRGAIGVVNPQRVRERPRNGSTALDGQPRTLGLPAVLSTVSKRPFRHLSDGHDGSTRRLRENLVGDANGRARDDRAPLVPTANDQQETGALHPRDALHGDVRQRKVRRLRVVGVEPRQSHPRAAVHGSQPPDRHLRAPRVTGTGAPGAQPDVHVPCVVVIVRVVRVDDAVVRRPASTMPSPASPPSPSPLR
mmetsp:Transcript_13256/g.53500  ORF Transcript_13256/g.53500 Transcript_13256/m.53500 type:complete len:209 (+) Transcript_13256:432-1058(+)